MTEKTRIPYVQETVLIDGTYQVERRRGLERRKNKRQWRFYERRVAKDKRAKRFKPLSIWV